MENDLDSLRMLTLAEAAELMHLSKRTLSRMIDRKEFSAFKVGSQLRVRERQLTQWIQGLNEL
jgi:excisionase family DNA binding protein